MRSEKEIKNKIKQLEDDKAKLLRNIDNGFVSPSDYTAVCNNIQQYRKIIEWFLWVLDTKV